uniref:DNA-directed RNA polymerase III subunit RPC4 n=1 Tax=Chromera velia CCMP2878 TaxID=1169474 RepID=A0A0G4HGJ6_9ALVE|eukprot:Cvel_27223.t1-p1 / transcript=Cvel_27223.t1 / gene=Cvel_27223 / organism=Chromera_velia_CCMP2878 / gene_product=DNA-directed RNA polymerase III subunit rpc4, putative / transcript_product=DNA-directed RNA polymerase III subunit rpc4, putative / location=Cvel_scaffold3366:13695-17456(-) / protein_length=414 / sequence_SO=supercontig / SO=protein_coding / is_pseudo=false
MGMGGTVPRLAPFAPNLNVNLNRRPQGASPLPGGGFGGGDGAAAAASSAGGSGSSVMQWLRSAQFKTQLIGDRGPGEGGHRRDRFGDKDRDRDRRGAFGQGERRAVPQSFFRYMPRKKEKKEGRSLDLQNLSWAEGPGADGGAFSYRPTTLPFVEREELDEQEMSPPVPGYPQAQSESPSGSPSGSPQERGRTPMGALRKSKRPTVKAIDEANRSAAGLFTRDEEDEDGDLMMVVQLPSVLPSVILRAPKDKEKDNLNSSGREGGAGEEKENKDRSGAASAAASRALDDYRPSRIEDIPPGKLGTLRVHKSGKARLQLGSHLFRVDAGSDVHFAQDVACLLTEELVVLGRPTKRMVVTPDVESILDQVIAEAPHNSALAKWNDRDDLFEANEGAEEEDGKEKGKEGGNGDVEMT